MVFLWFSPFNSPLIHEIATGPRHRLAVRRRPSLRPQWILSPGHDEDVTQNVGIYIWLVVWNMNFIFPYLGNNDPH